MDSFQTFLKAELPALAESHPDKSARERLQMARQTPKAQILLSIGFLMFFLT